MNHRGPVLVVVLLIAVLALGGVLLARGRPSATAPAAAGVVIYAPCGMTSPITTAAHLFRQANPELDLQIEYDNAIVLLRKIRAGARPDIFISPGELEMRQLTEEGFIDADSTRDFASLDLVVFAPSSTEGLHTIRDLLSPTVATVSLADPQYNSVGYYGERALRTLGLWERLQSKLILREYPLEAVTLVTSGDVDAGVTYLTCPLDTAPEKADGSDLRIIETFPRDTYPRVRCQIGLLNETQPRADAQLFIDFMVSQQAQEAITTHGLLPASSLEAPPASTEETQ